ncbi:MAG TPA: M23 family metallopeptidase [Usitatibacter sp.]|nr:M23 family metallopeptidase [Usitatibacter sp.]
MDPLHQDIERSWLRTVFILTLLTVLLVLAKSASWPKPNAGVELPVSSSGLTRTEAPPAPAETPTPANRLMFPLAGRMGALRDNFHEKRGLRTHKALDIMAPRGTPVRAVDDGVIAKFYRGPMAGIAVYQFDRDMKHVYFYAHLDRYAAGLEEGRPVTRGEVIGYVGSTGNAPESAPHLHFAMSAVGAEKRWWGGAALNPYELLRAAED